MKVLIPPHITGYFTVYSLKLSPRRGHFLRLSSRTDSRGPHIPTTDPLGPLWWWAHHRWEAVCLLPACLGALPADHACLGLPTWADPLTDLRGPLLTTRARQATNTTTGTDLARMVSRYCSIWFFDVVFNSWVLWVAPSSPPLPSAPTHCNPTSAWTASYSVFHGNHLFCSDLNVCFWIGLVINAFRFQLLGFVMFY